MSLNNNIATTIKKGRRCSKISMIACMYPPLDGGMMEAESTVGVGK